MNESKRKKKNTETNHMNDMVYGVDFLFNVIIKKMF